MNRGVPFDVEDFHPSQEPCISPALRPSLKPISRLSLRNSSRTLGLLGTFALHGAIGPFLLHGAVSHPKPPPPQEAGVSAAVPSAEELVLLTLTSAKGDSGLSAQIASLGDGLETLQMPAVSPSSLTTIDLPPDERGGSGGCPRFRGSRRKGSHVRSLYRADQRAH
jgi:hypothetical protein